MNDEAIGALNAQSSVRRCRIDDVTLTYVVDGAMAMVPEVFFPAIPQEYWAEHPEGLDAQRRVPMSAGGLLVERGSHRLSIDAGLGSIVGSIMAEHPLGQANSGAFIECLDGLGVAASDIDVLALTHLHPDHTGWMFSRTNSGPSEPHVSQCDICGAGSGMGVADTRRAILRHDGSPHDRRTSISPPPAVTNRRRQ